MYCRCTDGKTKCTNCVSLQRGLKLHACIYNDIMQEGVVVLTFETVGNWLLSSTTRLEQCWRETNLIILQWNSCHDQLNCRLLLCVHMLYALQFEIKVSYWIYTVIWVMKRRLSIINLTLEINLPTFRPKSPVVIRVKLLEHPVEMSFSELKLVTDNVLFIYSATNWKTTEAFGRWKYNQFFCIYFPTSSP